jgi:hypothetical protein
LAITITVKAGISTRIFGKLQNKEEINMMGFAFNFSQFFTFAFNFCFSFKFF